MFENGADTILRTGLAYDRCQVGVVTDLDGAAALAEFDIAQDEQMFKVLRSQVDVVLPGGAAVLNADAAGVANMAPLCDGEVIFYSANPDAPALSAQRSANGRALTLRQDEVVLIVGHTESFLPGLGKLSAWHQRHGASSISSSALLAAIGAAWALDIPLNLIGAGMQAFESNLQPAGRAV